MAYPAPRAGQIIRYAYLWEREARRGADEATKDRPCAVLLAIEDRLGGTVATVLPITHTPPRDLGLALDSEHLTPELLTTATAAILKTRDGTLRAAVPAPIGQCLFINDLSVEELVDTLVLHRKLCFDYPRGGDGIDMFTSTTYGSCHA